MPETAHRKQTRDGWFGLNCNMTGKPFVVRAGETGRHAQGIRKAQTRGEMVSKTVKGRSDPDQNQIRDLKTERGTWRFCVPSSGRGSWLQEANPTDAAYRSQQCKRPAQQGSLEQLRC